MADRPTANVARLPVKVIAGASQSAIAGWSGDRLRVRIAAVAERGKANAALIALIAKTLGLPRSAVRVAAGATSARKTLEISGLTQALVVARLGEQDGK
ncbi:MAG: DUF167 domain-containing protein [Gammaproteobacteria bacterium]|jgi:uncharacterized protein (TIGR00251 family)